MSSVWARSSLPNGKADLPAAFSLKPRKQDKAQRAWDAKSDYKAGGQPTNNSKVKFEVWEVWDWSNQLSSGMGASLQAHCAPPNMGDAGTPLSQQQLINQYALWYSYSNPRRPRVRQFVTQKLGVRIRPVENKRSEFSWRDHKADTLAGILRHVITVHEEEMRAQFDVIARGSRIPANKVSLKAGNKMHPCGCGITRCMRFQ